MFFGILGMIEEKRRKYRLKNWEKWIIILLSFFLFVRGVFYLMSNIYFTKASSLKEKKKFSSALSYYEKSLKFGTLSHLVYSNMGEIHYRLKNWDSAKSQYEKAIKIQPFHEVLYFHMGRIYLKLEDTLLSENMFKKAIKLEPQYGMACSFLGSLYRRRGKLEEALKILKKINKLLKKESSIYNELGIIYAELGNIKEAEKNFIKAIILFPHSLTLWYNLWVLRKGERTFVDGIAYEWVEEKLEENRRNISQILEKHPNHPKALLYKIKSSPLDVELLVTLLQIAPIKSIRATLLPILKGDKRWRKSEEALSWANKSFKKKEFKSAEKWLRRAINLNPTIGVAYYNLGVLLTKMNFPILAIEAYTRYLYLISEDKEVKKEINFLIKTHNIFE
jgi:tetratricopeptide (TPR) repeat protein